MSWSVNITNGVKSGMMLTAALALPKVSKVRFRLKLLGGENNVTFVKH